MSTSRRILAGLLSAGWIGLTIITSVTNLVFSATGQGPESPYLFVSFLGALAVPFVLLWRRQFPEIVMLIALVAGVLLPIGSTVAWVALGAMFRWREGSSTWRDAWLWAAAAAAAGVTYLAVARDLAAPTAEGSLLGIFLPEAPGENWRAALPWYTEAFTTAIMMAMVLGVCVVVRAQTRLSRASGIAAAAHSQNALLNQELARYEERDRIARELHDSLGNKLAALSMLSGAMRVGTHDPQAVRSYAEQLQYTAQDATAEMHEIIRTYRSAPAPPASLEDLQALIDKARRMGMLIASEVAIETPAAAPDAVARAVYRVVQEATTNATKHAPGRMLTVHVRGGPSQQGVSIHAANPLQGGAPAPEGIKAISGGNGLVGAGERVEQLGGWLRAGVQQGHFVVDAWVPWRVGGAV